jgi:isopenicillin-N epimerase
LIFPVKEICEKARSLGLITIIDGAHVPGHIDLDITALDPDFYTGTLHKWMLAPKALHSLRQKIVATQHRPARGELGYQAKCLAKANSLIITNTAHT